MKNLIWFLVAISMFVVGVYVGIIYAVWKFEPLEMQKQVNYEVRQKELVREQLQDVQEEAKKEKDRYYDQYLNDRGK